MTTQPLQTVLILGAGLTGLATAFHLNGQGHKVTLVDHSEWQDGSLINASDVVPILFGSHQETWRLLRAINRGRSLQLGTTIRLEFRLPHGDIAAYRSTRLPGALHWMASLFSFQGLSRYDRWKLFSHLEQIWEHEESLPADLENRISAEWLASIGQSVEAREHIWSPLAQWLTGNSLSHLSAATLVRLLRTVFLGRASDAILTYLEGSVEERLLTPMRQVLEQRGVQTLSQSQMPSVHLGEVGVDGVQLSDGTVLHAQWYISALSHLKFLPLLPERLLARYSYFAQLSELKVLPEITVQLVSPCHSMIKSPRVLLLADRPFHQLTITDFGPHKIRGRLAATGNQALAALSDSELIDLGTAELSALCPEIEKETARSVTVCRRDPATLSLRPGAALLRPIQQSPIRNLLVAGAWTDTGWPSNLESTLVSAIRCTEIITSQPS